VPSGAAAISGSLPLTPTVTGFGAGVGVGVGVGFGRFPPNANAGIITQAKSNTMVFMLKAESVLAGDWPYP
jgi:hypothetical protein